MSSHRNRREDEDGDDKTHDNDVGEGSDCHVLEPRYFSCIVSWTRKDTRRKVSARLRRLLPRAVHYCTHNIMA